MNRSSLMNGASMSGPGAADAPAAAARARGQHVAEVRARFSMAGHPLDGPPPRQSGRGEEPDDETGRVADWAPRHHARSPLTSGP